MRRVLLALAGFLGGFALGWAAAMAGYVAGDALGLWRDRDGGVAMGFAFTIGPLIGLFTGLWLAWRVSRRRGG